MTTTRQQILEAFKARLEDLTVPDGASVPVYLNEAPVLGPDDPDVAIVVTPGDDEVTFQAEQMLIRLPVDIFAVAKADLDAPWTTIEALLGDIKTAVETTDRTLGGLVRRQIERGSTRGIARETGSVVVGASVTYIAPYTEKWGTP